MFLRSGKSIGDNTGNQNTNTNIDQTNQSVDKSLNQTFSSITSENEQFNLALDTTMVDNQGSSQGTNLGNDLVTIKTLTPILQAERKYLDTRLQSIDDKVQNMDTKVQEFIDFVTQNLSLRTESSESKFAASSELSSNLRESKSEFNYPPNNIPISNKITVSSQPFFSGAKN